MRRSVCALLTLLTAASLLVVAGTGATAATADGRQAVGAANPPCVRPGQAAYPVSYFWKNAFGMRLGAGNISVDTSPALWGGEIAPGSIFTLTLTHRTTQWPTLVSSYTTTWDVASLVAYADVIGESGTGRLSGNTLSVTSPGNRTDPATKAITFRVRPGTVGAGMTIRPTGISSTFSAPGQLGNNTSAPPIRIVDGQSISPTRAADDTVTTTQNSAVNANVLGNDSATSPRISAVSAPGFGTATVSGGTVTYTPAPGFAGTDSFTYTITTHCGTATATVRVTVACNPTPVTLLNGSFETPPVATFGVIPDASANPSVGWRTTASDRMVELWRSGFGGVPAMDGQQFAELNANEVSTLYQDVPTVPGTQMNWSLYHRGRSGIDVMQMLIGAPGAMVPQVPSGASTADISDDNTAWGFYAGVYVVPAGQTVTRFAFQSVSAAGGGAAVGNLLDGVRFETPPCP